MVRDAMMQRNIGQAAAIQKAFAALQAGRFAAARDVAAPWAQGGAGALLYALGRAGAGDVEGAAPLLAAIARANPVARHPVHDLGELLRPPPLLLPHVRAALALRPDDAPVLELLGQLLAAMGPMHEAVDAYRRTTELAPSAGSFSNLGKSLAAEGRFEEAEAAFARALALPGVDSQLRLNHAIARLKSGRLAEGWELFRVRRTLPGYPAPRGPELRSLDGIAGCTLLLVHSEGFGDTIQFIRYARLLEALGARVLVDAPPALARLLAFNGFELAREGSGFDAWALVPDLPGLFGTTIETIPASLPYLVADPVCVAAWAARLPPGRRVGLVWAGAHRGHDPAAAATDRVRSIPPDLLAPLLATPGITWINLQYRTLAPPWVHDPSPAIQDFADTAAVIANLGAVVSVDTSVAHLAAAMAKPVLLLDRYDACWRWLHGRDDSPWYPGVVRIVRQDTPGDWGGVLRRAADSLTASAQSSSVRSSPNPGN